MLKKFKSRRAFALILALALCMGLLAGCGDKNSGDNGNGSNSTTENPSQNNSTTGNNAEQNQNFDVVFANEEFRIAKIPLNSNAPYKDAGNGFHDGLLKMVDEKRICGYIDQTGREVIPRDIYDYRSSDFSDGLAAVRKAVFSESGSYAGGSVFGFIDTQGKEIIPFEYEDARAFSEGLAAVKQDGMWGFIDKTGKMVISCQFSETGDFHDGMAAIRDDKDGVVGLWGYINQTGEIIIPCIYSYIHSAAEISFRDGLTFAWDGSDKSNSLSTGHLLDSNGNIVLEIDRGSTSSSPSVFWFNNEIVVRNGDTRTYYDYSGKEISESASLFAKLYNISVDIVDLEWHLYNKSYDDSIEGLIPFAEGEGSNQKQGFVDMDCNVMIPAKYDATSIYNLGYFREGIAFITFENGELLLIDRNGNQAQLGNGQDIRGFSDGLAFVEIDGNLYILKKIEPNGDIINDN